MNVGVTEQLARFVIDTSFKDMPEVAAERAKTMFLDTIGVALAGTAVGETGNIAIKYVEDVGGSPEAIAIGSGFRTSAPNAAFVNALLAHVLDFDDWDTSGHPSAMLVPASLALGEKRDLPGRSLLEAYILGLEVCDKIASGCPDITSRGWHGTALYGAIGAAAAGVKLLGLNVNQAIMAFGVAASAASGFRRQFGTMSKSFQVGNAARNGVEAALLASDGFTSDEATLEGSLGFCDCFQGQGTSDYTKMTHNLGNPFHIVSPGLGIKPYPCRYWEFRSIEATLDLRRQHGFICDDIDWVEVSMSPVHYQRVNFLEPKTGLQAKFSVNYAVAMAILDGKLTLATYTDDKVKEPKVREALGKIKAIEDATIPNEWADAWNVVTVKLKDGSIFSKRVDIPRGAPRNPLLASDVVLKYRDNASLVLSEEQVECSIKLLQKLEQVEHLRELTDILINPAAASKTA